MWALIMVRGGSAPAALVCDLPVGAVAVFLPLYSSGKLA